jgi:hypothetical protein
VRNSRRPSSLRPRSSARPSPQPAPTAAAFAPIARAPSRPRASICPDKKDSTKRIQQKGMRRPVRQVPRFSRARENRRELVNAAPFPLLSERVAPEMPSDPVPLCATAGGHQTTAPSLSSARPTGADRGCMSAGGVRRGARRAAPPRDKERGRLSPVPLCATAGGHRTTAP